VISWYCRERFFLPHSLCATTQRCLLCCNRLGVGVGDTIGSQSLQLGFEQSDNLFQRSSQLEGNGISLMNDKVFAGTSKTATVATTDLDTPGLSDLIFPPVIGDDNDPTPEVLRSSVIQAAYRARESGQHGVPFTALNGKTYSDVRKAFAAISGVKPCERCKHGSQGVGADYLRIPLSLCTPCPPHLFLLCFFCFAVRHGARRITAGF
jgi:hypothetical protein